MNNIANQQPSAPPPDPSVDATAGSGMLDKTGTETWPDFIERDARQPVALEAWAGDIVPDADLWLAMREAVAAVLGLQFMAGQSPEQGSAGIVVADQHLLALAAAAVLQPHARLLQSTRERQLVRQRQQDTMNADTDLGRFLNRCRRQPAAPGGWVMRCWDQPGLQAAAEAALADPVNRTLLAGGVVCLQHTRHVTDDGASAWGAQVALPVLADLSRNWKAVLGHVLWRLPLPADIRARHCADLQSAQELIDQLLQMGASGEQLLQDLNTPQFADFQRRVHRLHADDAPQQHELFERFVLDRDESHPRHAASLFLAAHFNELTPRQFIDLGDILVGHTPAATPAQDAQRDPTAITDRVLADCQIRFIRTKQGGAVVGLAVVDDPGPRQADRLNLGAAEALCALFEREAPLLKERYLACMGAHRVFGHPSDAVADRYLRLEVEALRTAQAGESYSAGERLRRIVFGAQPAGDPDALLRAMERAPELLATYAGSDDRVLQGALVDLCSGPAANDAKAVEPLIRMAMAGVFWTTYARLPARVGLRAFRAFFSDEVADAAQRRDDALALLRRILGAPDALGRFGPAEAPAAGLASQVMADTLRCFEDILDSGPRGLDTAMLVEAGLAHLEWHARGVPWSTRPAWSVSGATAVDGAAAEPSDLALARIVTSPRWVGWLHNPKARQSAPERQPGRRSLDDEGLLQLRIVRTVIDAWTGLTAFERWEAAALDVWFRKALGGDVMTVGRLRFYDRWYWHCLMNPNPDDEHDETCQRLVRRAVAPLLDSFGLLLLMVVTHQPAAGPGQPPRFVFSEALSKWLSCVELPDTRSPAQKFLRTLQSHVGPFQAQWEQAHREVTIVGELDLEAIRNSFADASQALQAFAAALHPLTKTVPSST